jgi:hypothetical protein
MTNHGVSTKRALARHHLLWAATKGHLLELSRAGKSGSKPYLIEQSGPQQISLDIAPAFDVDFTPRLE